MEMTFTSMIILDPKDLVRDPDVVILNTLKAKYENVCFKQYFIVEVKKIVARGNITFNMNEFPSLPRCDVSFTVVYITYEMDQLVALKIEKIEYDNVISGNDHIVAQTPLSNMEKYFKPKPGDYFIAIVDYVSYETFSKIAMNVSLYVPIMGYSVYRIVPGTANDMIKQAMEKALNYIDKALKNKKLEKFIDIFRTKNLSKLKLTKHTVFDKVPVINENMILAFCYFDPREEGIYYTAPDDVEIFNGYVHGVVAEGVCIENILYRYINDIYNFINMMEYLSKMTDEEFEKNKHIWKIYS